MKRYLITAAATAALMLAACGDDSSSSAGESSLYTRSGTLYVDEAQRLLVMTADETFIDQCVKEGESLVWKSMKEKVSSDSSIYDFLGDTLVVYSFDDGEPDHYGDLFVGGTAGNIYGTWTALPCEYNGRTGEKECWYNPYVNRKLKFSEGRVTVTIDYDYDAYLRDMDAQGYFRTYFVRQLYEVLNGANYFDADPTDVLGIVDAEDEEYRQRAIERNGVQILEESKTSQTFKIGEKTFTATVQKAESSITELGYENAEVVIDVTDGVTTCNGYAVHKVMDESLCKVENLEHIIMGDDDDYEDVGYIYARRYRDNNNDEFETCLKSIAVVPPQSEDASYTDYDALYKKVASNRSNSAEAKKRAEKRLEKWMKYIER